MQRILYKMSLAAALGMAGAAVLATPAQAQSQWTPPALELTSATCNTDGEWELEWSLTDTTGAVDNPGQYTYTVAEIITQIGDDSGPWEDAALEGTLQVGAVLPRTGEGSLTGIQTVPGDTERVKLRAQSDRAGTPVDDKRKEGRGLKNSLQHALELEDCAAPIPPEPVDVPELDYGVGIVIDNDVDPEPVDVEVDAEWVVDFTLPEGAPQDTPVQYQVMADISTGDGGDTDGDGGDGDGDGGDSDGDGDSASASGDADDTVQTGEVQVGASTLRIPVTGPLEEVELVSLELMVDGSEPMLLEAELPAIDSGTGSDPTTSADPTQSTPSAQPALPTTGVPIAVAVGAAAALIATGAFVVNRARARQRHDGAF